MIVFLKHAVRILSPSREKLANVSMRILTNGCVQACVAKITAAKAVNQEAMTREETKGEAEGADGK
jgi:hypothetical protein